MKLSKMNAFLGTVALVCACNAPGSNHGQLVANSDAQHAGVYAYAVEDGIVTMFDRDGIELGRVSVTTPSPDQRYFKAEMTDGTEDQVEVYRPMADGRFIAPLAPETALTATLTDPALRDAWAKYDVTFMVALNRRFAGAELGPSGTEATTTACTSYSCSGSGCTPAGCAKPANTTQCFSNDGNHTACTLTNTNRDTCFCCDNLAVLPASVAYRNIDTGTTYEAGGDYSTPKKCQSVISLVCGTAGFDCLQDANLLWQVWCYSETSGNSWVASCARNVGSTCPSGQFDAVPRNGDCVAPGSCTYSTGTVGCTTYH